MWVFATQVWKCGTHLNIRMLCVFAHVISAVFRIPASSLTLNFTQSATTKHLWPTIASRATGSDILAILYRQGTWNDVKVVLYLLSDMYLLFSDDNPPYLSVSQFSHRITAVR